MSSALTKCYRYILDWPLPDVFLILNTFLISGVVTVNNSNFNFFSSLYTWADFTCRGFKLKLLISNLVITLKYDSIPVCQANFFNHATYAIAKRNCLNGHSSANICPIL